MRPKAFYFYLDYLANIEDLSKEQIGELVLALLHYANTWEDGKGEVPEMSLIVKVAFAPIRKQMDAEFKNYQARSETNSENARKRWQKVAEEKDANDCDDDATICKPMRSHEEENEEEYKHNKEDNKNTKKTSYLCGFCKPTLDEVIEYCDERKNMVNPQQFYNYYESNGWKVGRNPMKDWKAAVRTWEQKQKPSSKQSPLEVFGKYLGKENAI